MLYEYLLAPFVDFGFMLRGLMGGVFLAISASMVGVFLIWRRMSLVADAMAHAILPGVALGFLIAGTSLVAMVLGGFVMGLLVAGLAGLIARFTSLKEDSSFAAMYLISLGLGLMLISLRGSNNDLTQLLFGAVVTIDDAHLLFMMVVSSLTLVGLACIYRPLVMDCLDPRFLRLQDKKAGLSHGLFLLLFVGNLLAGFQVLGTLMAVGMMLLPAIVARLLGRTLGEQLVLAVLVALFSVYTGLLLSYHANLPGSACIILMAATLYVLTLLFAPREGLLWRWQGRKG